MAFRVTPVEGEATDCHVLARMIRAIEMSGDWFGYVLSYLSTSHRCSQKQSHISLPAMD